ncbi:MAG: ABC transporter ATP-binding protein, partial [Bacillota bacterium]
MSTIWRLLGYLRRYPKWVAYSLLCMLGLVGMAFVVPWLTRYVIDMAIIDQQWHLLLPLALAVVGAAVLQSLFVFGRRYSSALVGQSVIYDLRNELYRHLHQLPFSFYDHAQTGQLMSRVTQDVETMRRFLGFGVVNLARSILMFFGVLIFLLYINWELTLLILLTAPPLAFTVWQFSRRVRPMYRQLQQRLAELTAVLQENVSGIRVVSSFAREEYEIEKFDEQNRAYLEKNIETVRNWAFFFPLMNMITGMGTVIILWYGGRQVMAGVMTLGWLIAYTQYLNMLLGPLRMMGWLVNLLERAVASGQRVFEILDTRSDIEEKPDAIVLPEVRGHVQLRDVWFRYDDGGRWVLRGINLDAPAGGRVALLGATGSGKTTVINMIPRFYDPCRGSVLLDGHDLKDLSLNTVRRSIGMVMQETFLFSAPIRENIAYGRPDASMEQIEEAARAAQIHDFILSLPEGYDTVVGERGVGLSGGQKQRVAIARALLLNPPILILDDSTSSVDVETEHLIQDALDNLMEGRTSFVIAQRLSSIRNADQIIVLDRGEVVQRGDHETLLREPGIYHEIYQLQSKGQDELSEELFERAR